MRTPSSARPAFPHGLEEDFGKAEAAAARFDTTLRPGCDFAVFFATGLLPAAFGRDFIAFALLRVAIVVSPLYLSMIWFSVPGAYSTPGHSSIDAADLFLANHALRIEVADAAALGPGRRVDRRVDEGRLAGVHGRVDGALELVGRCHMSADAAECLRHLVVARAFDEDRCRRVRTAGGIGVGAAIDAIVVEDDDADRQVVPANRLHFHAGETKGAIAFDREHGFAGLDCGRDGK